MFVALVIQHAKRMCCGLLYCHLWPAWLYRIFAHNLINGTIFEKKKILVIKCFDFFHHLSEKFIILKMQRDIITVHRSSCKVPVIPVAI